MSDALDLLRVMIVDDEAPAREGLRLRLRRERDVVVTGAFGDAASALAALRVDRPDLLFLDVHMPGMDGFAFLERLAELGAPPVVFVTAFDEYAVRAFEVRALDYLLKPVEQERLHDAVERARDRSRERRDRERDAELSARLRGLVAEFAGRAGEPIASTAGAARIAVRTGDAIRFVDPASIDYVDAAGDGVRLHVAGTTHLVRKSMSEMLALLPATFVRIHRSTIVNVARVAELQPHFHGEFVVVMHNGARLKLSCGYRETAGRALGV